MSPLEPIRAEDVMAALKADDPAYRGLLPEDVIAVFARHHWIVARLPSELASHIVPVHDTPSAAAERVAERLHAAADRITELLPVPPPEMDTLSMGAALFLSETSISDELAVPIEFTPRQAMGYGVMLGYILRGEGPVA